MIKKILVLVITVIVLLVLKRIYDIKLDKKIAKEKDRRIELLLKLFVKQLDEFNSIIELFYIISNGESKSKYNIDRLDIIEITKDKGIGLISFKNLILEIMNAINDYKIHSELDDEGLWCMESLSNITKRKSEEIFLIVDDIYNTNNKSYKINTKILSYSVLELVREKYGNKL